jgi:allophanate hydrolase subunit 1
VVPSLLPPGASGALVDQSWFAARFEIAVSVFIAPGAFAAQPLIPLLKMLGLTTGEWVRLPSLMGWLILSLGYAGGIAFIYEMLRRFSRAQRKHRQ